MILSSRHVFVKLAKLFLLIQPANIVDPYVYTSGSWNWDFLLNLQSFKNILLHSIEDFSINPKLVALLCLDSFADLLF